VDSCHCGYHKIEPWEKKRSKKKKKRKKTIMPPLRGITSENEGVPVCIAVNSG
jgi:predicted ribosome quality control (RQC) complex YloA/Tae2 family protein